ncbi:hypothetical protein [Pseudonocardia oroxyli]|uniref:Uncharacterized protein n=1 Tax=Pseudonocardia oroxyli TaxID=366584 RepID=A0A1G7RK26_PSEOR|nr:hypothetical protein [Pseudonocardia oroxyli]SDG11111.1 hypothetical protein SAMN05216377_10952 [Pseudonocardia oroxyli]
MFEPGSAILYMKVGTHAKEELSDIIERKQREIEDEGMAMWGYGGNTCHPTTMVQPFARTRATDEQPIVLAMQPMKSKHFADPVRADEYSQDGKIWTPVPQGINVLGSRYALCIRTLEQVDTKIHLAETKVAIGKSLGKAGSSYVKGRVDKACLEVTSEAVVDEDEGVPIGLIAELVDPYAVFLRNS